MIALGAAARPSSSSALLRFERSQPHMGTTVRLVFYAATEGAADRAAGAAFARVAALDAALSDYRPNSELAALCRRAGEGPVPVGPDLFQVLALAQDWAGRSGGAFDVTVGPLTHLWRRARRLAAAPDAARLAQARVRVGYAKLRLDPAARTAALAEPGMALDLGGIAKGFAAGEAAAAMRKEGVRRALVAVGGDLVALEPPPDRSGWDVVVATAAGREDGPRIALAGAAVSTSGDAEQSVELAGVRHSHILDPRTGRPVTGRFSVTVVAPSGAAADALSTAVAVLGPDAGLALVDATAGAAALVVVGGNDQQRLTSLHWDALTPKGIQ